VRARRTRRAARAAPRAAGRRIAGRPARTRVCFASHSNTLQRAGRLLKASFPLEDMLAKARVLGSSLEAADQKSSLRSWVPAQKIRVAILRAGTQGKATESPPEKKRGRTRGEITSVQGLTDEPLNCGPSDDFVTSLDRYLGTPRRILSKQQ